MIQKFRTDPAYLCKYYRTVILALLAACALLVEVRAPRAVEYLWYLPAIMLAIVPKFLVIVAAFVYAVAVSLTVQHAGFHPLYLVLLPTSLLLALLATSYIHNAAHDNIRPRWLRRTIGEGCGLFHLVGFPDWTIVHFIHHRHPDDPEWDPHPPAGLNYWRFMNGVKSSVFRVLQKRYFSQFGDSPEAQHYWKALPFYAMLAQILKVHFWFLLLGGQAFSFLFLASIVAKNLHYAFFNYATHIPSPEDPSRMVIVNLEGGVFRAINALSHNLYMHRNHHDHPALFNPGGFSSATIGQPEPMVET